MKVVLGAAAAVMLFATAALAQTETAQPAAPAVAAQSRCPAIQPAPTLPDGAAATMDEIAAGDNAYQEWAPTLQATLQCRRAEQAEAAAVADALLQQHNAGVAALNTTTQAWTAERAEFCARPRMRCRQ